MGVGATRMCDSAPHGRNDFTRYAWRSVANYCIADSCREIKMSPKLKAAKEEGACHSRD